MLSTVTTPVNIMVKPAGSSCNLSCSYCYYLEKSKLYPHTQTPRISDATLEQFIVQYLEIQPPGATQVVFGWQGGEPTLLGIDFYKKVVALQQKHNRRNLKIINSIQTNGFGLKDEWFPFFREHNFLVGLSVDGPRELHDRQRRGSSGKGSFEAARETAERLRDAGVDYNLLAVVSPVNVDHPLAVYQALKELGAYIQFIPLVIKEPLSPAVLEKSAQRPDLHFLQRKPTIESVDPRRYGKFLKRVFDIWLKEDLGQVFVQQFDEVISLLLGGQASSCVHARDCGTSMVLEHDGSLYSCDHLVFPQNGVGNLEDNSLVELTGSAAQRSFARAKTETLPGECSSCPYLRFCHGGCPIHRTRYRGAKKETFISNYLCKGYQAFFKHTLPACTAIARCMQARRPLADYRN